MAKANRRRASSNKGAQGQGTTNRGERGLETMTMSRNGRMARVGASAAQLTRSARASGRRIERSVTSAVQDNPLIVGAALFACGAALGYVMRGVLRDSLWLEEQREAVMEKARELARSASSKVNSLRQQRPSQATEAY